MGEYRLADDHRHLQLDRLKWFNMGRQQRESYAEKVLLYREGQQRRAVSVIDVEVNIPTVSDLKLKEIWERAAIIIESYHVLPLENYKFCVTEDEECWAVERKATACYSCQCNTFKVNGLLCQHVVVVGEKQGDLHEYLRKIERKESKAVEVMCQNLPNQRGQKPGAKPRRGKNNAQQSPIIEVVDKMAVDTPKPSRFTEYYHNDEPFEIVFIKDFKKAKQCESCGNAIPKRFLTRPFDIIFLHKERYQYPVKDDQGKFLRMTVTRKKLGKKYYCLKKECVLKRHPYFWIGRISTSKEVKSKLHQSHVDYLKETIGYKP